MLGHRGGRTGLGWDWSLARRLMWFARGLKEIMCAWHVVEVQKILFPFLFLPYSWHRHLPRDWDQKCGRLILVFPVLDPAQAVTRSRCHQVRKGDNRDQKGEVILGKLTVCLWPEFVFWRSGPTGAWVKGVLWLAHLQGWRPDECFLKQRPCPLLAHPAWFSSLLSQLPFTGSPVIKCLAS